MKATSGRLSDYQIRPTAANRDSAQSSVGNCIKESFLVDERSLLEICAVAVGQREGALETKRGSAGCVRTGGPSPAVMVASPTGDFGCWYWSGTARHSFAFLTVAH